MSWQATAYVKTLVTAPNGEPITRSEKLLLFVLADSHNAGRRVAWPSVTTMAFDCLMSERQIQYILRSVEPKGIIEIIRPLRTGRGYYQCYRFVALDADCDVKQKGAMVAPFSAPETAQEPCKTTHKRTKEGCKIARLHKESGIEQGTLVTKNITPDGALTNDLRKHALKTWLATKDRLNGMLPEREWKLWVRPAYLLKPLSGSHLLIALPPNNAIMRAAQNRLETLRAVLAESGYNASFTRYPDGYDRERLRVEHPDFYVQMFGVERKE